MPAAEQERNHIEKEGVLKEGERSPEEKKKASWKGCLERTVNSVTSCQRANEVRNKEVPSSDNRGSQGAWSQLCQSNGRGSGNEESGHQCHLEISSPEETSDTIWPEKSPGILGDEENLREKEMVTEKPKKKKGEETDSEENKRQTRNDSSQKMSVRLRAHRQGEYQRGPQPSKVP